MDYLQKYFLVGTTQYAPLPITLSGFCIICKNVSFAEKTEESFSRYHTICTPAHSNPVSSHPYKNKTSIIQVCINQVNKKIWLKLYTHELLSKMFRKVLATRSGMSAFSLPQDRSYQNQLTVLLQTATSKHWLVFASSCQSCISECAEPQICHCLEMAGTTCPPLGCKTGWACKQTQTQDHTTSQAHEG